MSVAEVYELPVAQQPLVPPSPPRAAQKSGALSWMTALRKSALSAWSQRAYEEDIIQGGFFGRSGQGLGHRPEPGRAVARASGQRVPARKECRSVDAAFAAVALADRPRARRIPEPRPI